MRRVIYAALAALLCFCLVSCSKTPANKSNETPGISGKTEDNEKTNSKKTVSKDEDFVGTETENGYFIAEYTGDAQIINIPETLDGKKVVGIEFNAFRFSEPEEVYFSSGIKEVPMRCFEHQSKLRKVVLNEGIEAVGFKAFILCTSLESINIPSTVTAIYHDAFTGCEKLEEIVLPDSLEKLEYTALGGTGIKSIVIPATLAELEDGTLCGCENLTDIYFLNDNIEISVIAFDDCPDVVLHGAEGSTAQAFAKEHEYKFVAE